MSERALRGMDPTKPFFMAVTPEYLDGSIDHPEGCGYEGCFETQAEAVDCLKDVLSEYLLDGYVYRCIPVAKVGRSKIKVSAL